MGLLLTSLTMSYLEAPLESKNSNFGMTLKERPWCLGKILIWFEVKKMEKRVGVPSSWASLGGCFETLNEGFTWVNLVLKPYYDFLFFCFGLYVLLSSLSCDYSVPCCLFFYLQLVCLVKYWWNSFILLNFLTTKQEVSRHLIKS
jgi:hypothetical protein